MTERPSLITKASLTSIGSLLCLAKNADAGAKSVSNFWSLSQACMKSSSFLAHVHPNETKSKNLGNRDDQIFGSSTSCHSEIIHRPSFATLEKAVAQDHCFALMLELSPHRIDRQPFLGTDRTIANCQVPRVSGRTGPVAISFLKIRISPFFFRPGTAARGVVQFCRSDPCRC